MTAERKVRSRRKAFAYAAVATTQIAAATAMQAHAQEPAFGWGLNAGVEHSDNIARTADDEQSETVGVAGVQLSLDQDMPRLDALVAADLQYREYLDDTFDSEVVGGFNGVVSYAFAPERFIWTVQDNYGQISNQRQLADTPANRQDFNYFTTGPDLILPLGGRTQMILAGRWSDTYYEQGTQDAGAVSSSETLRGSLALLRQLSDTSSISLNGSVSETSFDEEDLVEDYEIQEGFVRYTLNARRTELSADAGYTVLRQAGESSDGILARVGVSRRVAARSRVSLQAGTEFSTTADVFRRDQTIVGVDVGAESAVASSDAFQTDYAYLTWSTDWVRSGFGVELSAREEEHELLTALDREQLGAGLTWSRQLTQAVGLNLRAGYVDEKFVESGFQFDEWSAGFGLNWRLSRRFGLELTASHLEGSGDSAGRDYEENRAYIGLTYGRGLQ